MEENLLKLREQLAKQTYRPGKYSNFHVHEPKRRLISAAPFRDRVVHHALCNLLEPVFERSFIHDSYANRVKKGTHRALARCQEFARRYPFVLQCDLKQFFPSLDHQILMRILRRRIQDPKVIWLAEEILRNGDEILEECYDMVFYPGDDLFALLRPRGLPIGNLTSQFWANVYMNPFDHFVKRELQCRAYLRFVDDFLLFGDSKAALWRWKEKVERRLSSLRLTVHPGAHPRPVTEGVPFLGFTVFPDHRRLKRRRGVYYGRRLGSLLRDWDAGRLDDSRIEASVRGWVNHVRYANTTGLRKALFASTGVDRWLAQKRLG